MIADGEKMNDIGGTIFKNDAKTIIHGKRVLFCKTPMQFMNFQTNVLIRILKRFNRFDRLFLKRLR